ncbi:MAG: endonuclease [Aeromicrobium sp.]|nr:endonuclease [Aeromicrobium sp.]
MNPQPTIGTVLAAMRRLEVGDVRDKLHALQEAQDAMDAAKAICLAGLQACKDYEIDGASTLKHVGA